MLLHPTNLERLRTEDERHLLDFEQAYHVSLAFRADPTYRSETERTWFLQNCVPR